MSEAKLDQLVKGAPAPNTSLPAVASSIAANPPSAALAAAIHESHRPTAQPPSDFNAAASHHSSPPQIYVNLLILEASLRAQYLALYARRRQHTFFILLLTLWLAYFTYALFLRPREDGKGHGGSVYWVVDMYEKVSFIGGLLTAILIWATGQWDRGVRWPRRWVVITNRGLRVMNLKVVVLKGPWWTRTFSYLAFLIPHRSYFRVAGSSYRYIPIDPLGEKHNTTTTHGTSDPSKHDSHRKTHLSRNYVEEDIAPGGDQVKLLLLPKSFSAEFRQNWEVYRTEYWDKENERRGELRKGVSKRDRDEAREQGGWWWWTGWRGWRRVVKGPEVDVEMLHHHHHATQGGGKEPSARKARGGSGETHSRSSSRSSNASGTPEPDSHGRPPSNARKNKSTVITSTRTGSSFSSASSSSSSSSSRKSPSTAVDSPDSSELSDTGSKTTKLRKRAAEAVDPGAVADRQASSLGEERKRRVSGVEQSSATVEQGIGARRMSMAEGPDDDAVGGRTRQRDLNISAEEG